MKRILALIDGEHYLPVTKAAIEKLKSKTNQKVVAALFLGGTEKIGSLDEVTQYLKLPIYFLEFKSNFQKIIQEIITKFKITSVFDLSDEPVVTSQDRMNFACAILLEGCSYNGADFEFTPINFLKNVNKPIMSVIGTGKRVGKTAIAGYIARVVDKTEWTPCILTMGRGGPATPEVIRGDQLVITAESLLEVAQQGKHAASDYWEDALTSRVITIGCRRCAGGLAGAPYLDNVEEGIRIAEKLPVDLIIAEGSGPTIPPVWAQSFIVIVGAQQPIPQIKGILNPYRIKLSELAIITNCELPIATDDKVREMCKTVKGINPKIKVCCTTFRPKVLGNIRNKDVFYASTIPLEMMETVENYLSNKYECNIVGTSQHLSDRTKLKKDLKRLAQADVLVTELKAAAIDIATKTAFQLRRPTIFCDNELQVKGSVDGDIDSIQELNLYLKGICERITKGRAASDNSKTSKN
ncbi:MAG: 2,3-diphosphoglycerate synthetase [Candidatus Lokiarchaeota archaeon]|nr:2,3-diphosphoglycerate synthetase [Candidatus Lokiarchaeota archaeon]